MSYSSSSENDLFVYFNNLYITINIYLRVYTFFFLCAAKQIYLIKKLGNLIFVFELIKEKLIILFCFRMKQKTLFLSVFVCVFAIIIDIFYTFTLPSFLRVTYAYNIWIIFDNDSSLRSTVSEYLN